MLEGRASIVESCTMVVTTGAPELPAVHEARPAAGLYVAAVITFAPLPLTAVGRPFV